MTARVTPEIPGVRLKRSGGAGRTASSRSRLYPLSVGLSSERKQIPGFKAGMDTLKVLQALDEESGGDQQQQRQRYLGHHQSFAQSHAGAADNRSGLILQGAGKLRAGGLNRRRKAEEHPR